MSALGGDGVFDKLSRIMDYEISVGKLIEVWLWTAVPYLIVGLVWSGFNATYAQRIEATYLSGLPAGAEVVAYVDSALLWPVLIFAPGICPA